jgi:hypothetical protein
VLLSTRLGEHQQVVERRGSRAVPPSEYRHATCSHSASKQAAPSPVGIIKASVMARVAMVGFPPRQHECLLPAEWRVREGTAAAPHLARARVRAGVRAGRSVGAGVRVRLSAVRARARAAAVVRARARAAAATHLVREELDVLRPHVAALRA